MAVSAILSMKREKPKSDIEREKQTIINITLYHYYYFKVNWATHRGVLNVGFNTGILKHKSYVFFYGIV